MPAQALKVSLYELPMKQIDELNILAKEFLTEAHGCLKSRGFVRATSIQSALYEWRYTMGARHITLSGWHGTGKPGTSRFYGAGKNCMNIYDDHPDAPRKGGHTYTPVIEIPLTFDKASDIKPAHVKGYSEMLKYLKAV